MNRGRYILEHLKSKFDKSRFDRTTDKWYYFLHIPKTAGTTFRYTLYNYFDQAEIYPNYFELMVCQRSEYFDWKEYRDREPQLFSQKKRLLIGHFGWAPLRFYKHNNPSTLTFLRDPVNRVKSAILYHQQRDRKYKDLAIDDILDQYAIVEGTLQARHLGYKAKKDNMQRALENLESIDFIGIAEQFDRSLVLCNHTLGWNLEAIPKRNVGSNTDNSFSPEHIAKIESACELDYIIYRRGVELFNERFKSNKLTI